MNSTNLVEAALMVQAQQPGQHCQQLSSSFIIMDEFVSAFNI